MQRMLAVLPIAAAAHGSALCMPCLATLVTGVVAFAARYVASGPLVRSSYRAGEFFIEAMIKKDAAERAAAA